MKETVKDLDSSIIKSQIYDKTDPAVVDESLTKNDINQVGL